MSKIFIVIPAYNEGRSIEKVIKDLREEGYKNIIVVDDGSKDNTYLKAKKARATVIKHIINRGYGAALHTGTVYSIVKKADVIVQFDADGQHNSKEIKKLTEPIIKKEVEVSLGSRFLKKQDIPLSKKVVLRGGILVNWIFCGLKLTDAHNGFRAFSREAAMKMRIKTDKMEYASEIIEEIRKRNLKYKEIPVTIRYTDYSVNKGQKISNSINILLKMILKKMKI